MFTLRQHIASLIAVFFSMTIGILMGVALTGPPGKEQSLLLRRIEARLRRLADENRGLAEKVKELEASLSFRDRVEEQLLSLVGAGRLEGRGLALIWIGKTEGREALLASLTTAGAKVVGEVEVRPGLARVQTEVARRVERALGIAPKPMVVRSPPERTAYLLASSIVKGEAPKILSLLRMEGATNYRGTFGAPADTVLILHPRASPGGSIPPEVKEGLVKGADDAGAYVVACETTQVPEEASFVPLYRRLGVPTVDNVDIPPGRIALILVLEGRKGHFGRKSTAESAFPLPGG